MEPQRKKPAGNSARALPPVRFYDKDGKEQPPFSFSEADKNEWIKNRDEADRARLLGAIGKSLQKEVGKWRDANGGKLPSETDTDFLPGSWENQQALAIVARRGFGITMETLHPSYGGELPEEQGRITLARFDNHLPDGRGGLNHHYRVSGKMVINPTAAELAFGQDGSVAIANKPYYLPMLNKKPDIAFPRAVPGKPPFLGGTIDISGQKDLTIRVDTQFAPCHGALKMAVKSPATIKLGARACNVIVQPEADAVIYMPVTKDSPFKSTSYAAHALEFAENGVSINPDLKHKVKLVLFDACNPARQCAISFKDGYPEDMPKHITHTGKMRDYTDALIESKLKAVFRESPDIIAACDSFAMPILKKTGAAL